jgi:ABC-type sugar transport system ATPase subunit
MTVQTNLKMLDITKSFGGVPAISRASIEVRGGEALALMGANGAGKSTLMNILGGVLPADTGKTLIDDRPVTIRSPREASANGISFVHQELMMFPTMSVAENIFIEEMPTSGMFIKSADMIGASQKLLNRLGSSIDPRTPVEFLSIGDRQLVEIARALRQDARIVIFDEPTSSLSLPERQRLFKVIESLKSEGVAVIYITHFLDEIFQVCEAVSVMRNGETVFNAPISDLTPGKVVELMLGVTEEGGRLRQTPDVQHKAPMLEVNGLSRAGALEDINFQIGKGEIVGLWGLLGSGRTELVRALVGLDPIDQGVIELDEGKGKQALTPGQLHEHVGLVTEDRRGEGVHLPLSVADNLALPNLKSLLNKWGLVSAEKEAQLAEQLISRLGVKVSDRNQPIGTLSGGNQQKVVFGKWVATNPKLFILDEPTRGLDVHAKTEIMRLVVELAEQGTSCLVVSSELEELMRVCDRYLVIGRGRLIGELPGSATTSQLMAAISTVDEGVAA